MKTTFKTLSIMLLAFVLFSVTSCKKHDHDHDHEDEITTLEITFTEIPIAKPGGLKSEVSLLQTVMKYSVIDGDVEVDITGNSIVQNIAYNYSIRILNEEEDIDLTEEIEEEADDHLFCITGVSGIITLSEQNNDSKGKTFGSQGVITFTTSGENTTRITLKHEPNKNAGNPCSTGDTDIEATFNFNVNSAD
jgi:hypothetical protein